MIIGIPKEIKRNECRVAITPQGVAVLVERGHRVLVETRAGRGSGFDDEAYAESGARIVTDMAAVYREAELVLKVKELFPEEFALLREGQIIFTYLHSAGNPRETQALLDQKVVALAYEDILTDDGRAPLLAPMSEIAGEVGLLMGAWHLFATNGGRGLLIGGAVGAEPAQVAILGAGHAGLGAARCAIGLGGAVTLLDIDLERLREVRQSIFPQVPTLFLSSATLRELLPRIDLLINAVKWPPVSKGHLVTREMLGTMQKGSLIVDIACDPAGAIETCVPTSHDQPLYEKDGVRHLCIDNLPSAVARTASFALSSHSLPYVLMLADKGWLKAVKEDRALRRGLGFALGHLTFRPTAEVQQRPYTSPEELIAMLAR